MMLGDLYADIQRFQPRAGNRPMTGGNAQAMPSPMVNTGGGNPAMEMPMARSLVPMLRPRQKMQRQRFVPMGPFGIPGSPQGTGGYDSSGINPYGSLFPMMGRY